MIIANREQIARIIERLVHQIAEQHFDKKRIIFVGIKESGLTLAKEVVQALEKILKIELEIIELEIDKKKPNKGEVKISDEISKHEEAIIIVDDVINSGRTLFYALKPFLNLNLNTLQTLILVERKYKRFPITADYVGISLNTTMKEHIAVQTDKGRILRVELN